MEINENYLCDINLPKGVKNFLLESRDQHLSFESMDVIELSRGHVKMRLKVDERTCNPYGVVHGGSIFTLCDSVAGLTAITTGAKCVTLSNSMNFLRPATSGYIYAIPEIVHKGRTTFVIDVTVKDDFDKVIAKGSFTMYVIGNMSEYEDIEIDG